MSKIKKLGLGIVAFEGCEHLKNIISTIKDSVDYIVVSLQHYSYHGLPIEYKDIQEAVMCKEMGLIDDIIWYVPDLSYMANDFHPNEPRYLELEKRNQLLDFLESKGCSHALILDGDEFLIKDQFEYAKGVFNRIDDVKASYCPYVCYYKDYEHIFDCVSKPYIPLIAEIKYRYLFGNPNFSYSSDYTRRWALEEDVHPFLFIDDEICAHNLSWVRNKIENKVDNWSSKSYFDKIEGIREACISDHEKYSGEDEVTVYINAPTCKMDIKKLDKQIIQPKYELGYKL